jgi:hypothetical protein
MKQLKNTCQKSGKLEGASAEEEKQQQAERMVNSVEGQKETPRLNKINLQGKRVNKLVVLGIDSRDRYRNIKWLCRCDCGKLTIKTTTSLNGGVISCGCAINEARKRRAIHNKTNTRTYRIWAGMIQRCTNPRHHKYPRYGARGITVCNSWMNFSSFLKDMGECPDEKQIDRINNNGNYSKENCRWVDIKTQARNRSNNRIIEMNGVKKTMAEWCEELKISPVAVRMRIHRGWNPIESLTRKLRIWQ